MQYTYTLLHITWLNRRSAYCFYEPGHLSFITRIHHWYTHDIRKGRTESDLIASIKRNRQYIRLHDWARSAVHSNDGWINRERYTGKLSGKSFLVAEGNTWTFMKNTSCHRTWAVEKTDIRRCCVIHMWVVSSIISLFCGFFFILCPVIKTCGETFAYIRVVFASARPVSHSLFVCVSAIYLEGYQCVNWNILLDNG